MRQAQIKNLIIAIGQSITEENYQINLKDINDLIVNILGNNHTKKIHLSK